MKASKLITILQELVDKGNDVEIKIMSGCGCCDELVPVETVNLDNNFIEVRP